ncbi:hypothetical protein [Frateuria aurantia]|uniref:Uncharacterized protein n=1 Tax=Frateuria aurantia (strain ATCC 33424 / DSM 6220 / KCTC 2777 / LMG 1558 / NBRC 3245 / NCIMB 13370) TaxID=767434 RepID=H8L662_FRAAD|nr:hypothetical protein [Frateuria aurantia]AFC85906.1 hypothetical protein Fraau_1484 [Frateuria aurantia DSM 6220]
MAGNKSTKPATDWERIEADYRAGVLSIREIAGNHGITDTAIRKRAKAHGWERDLAEKIRAKAESKVRSAEVRTQVRTEGAISDRELIEANAEVIANVRMAHRQDIGRARSLAMSLLAELESQTHHLDMVDQLRDLVVNSEDGIDAKLLTMFQAVTSLPGRTKTMKELADSLQKLVTLERDAYGLAEASKVELTGKNGEPIQQQVSHVDERTVSAVIDRLNAEF